jgi:hypothetical protein
MLAKAISSSSSSSDEDDESIYSFSSLLASSEDLDASWSYSTSVTCSKAFIFFAKVYCFKFIQLNSAIMLNLTCSS